MNAVLQQYPFKSILNLCPWLHMGAITNKKHFFCCSLIFPPFYNGLIQTFSLPNRAAQKAPGISGQSNAQSSMGQNSKERNTSGFRIMEVMINMEGYTSSLTMNSMFWSDGYVFYYSILIGYFLSWRVGQQVAWKSTLPAANHCSHKDTAYMGQDITPIAAICLL